MAEKLPPYHIAVRHYHQQAVGRLKWIWILVDTGWLTPAVKPDIERALKRLETDLEKLEKVDVDPEVNYNAR